MIQPWGKSIDTIRYHTKYRGTIRSASALPYVRTYVVSYSILKGRMYRQSATGRRRAFCAFQDALPALSAISSSTQRNTCNARNATYARSGQWHGWNLSHGMSCVRLEACFGPSIACFSLAYSAVRPRTSMYADVRCHKARSCCVRWRILHACTWKYDNVRLRMPMYGNVRRRTSMQDAADAKIICYLT